MFICDESFSFETGGPFLLNGFLIFFIFFPEILDFSFKMKYDIIMDECSRINLDLNAAKDKRVAYAVTVDLRSFPGNGDKKIKIESVSVIGRISGSGSGGLL